MHPKAASHHYSRHARVFDFLSEKRQLGILQAIHGGEMDVTRLHAHIGTTLPNVSHNLGTMLEQGLVSMRKSGKHHYYKLEKPEIMRAAEHIKAVCSNPNVRKPFSSIAFALAEPHRIQILEMLGQREMNVGEIMRKVNLSQTNTSHHIEILSLANLVVFQRRGKNNYYRLVDRRILDAIEAVKQALSAQ